MALLRTSLQVVAAVAIILLLFIIAYSIFNREAMKSLREAQQLRNRIDIFTGVKDMALTIGESYNTVDENSALYKNLKPSVNQAGGIEYTYNFWLYKDNGFQTRPPITGNLSEVPADAGLDRNDVILLLRGVDKAVNYKNICSRDKKDVFVKCPLIKLENFGDSLTVEFNTKKSPDVVHEGSKNMCDVSSTDWDEMNAHKVSIRNLANQANFDKQWFMVTVILQDTYPEDPLPFRNRVRVRIYINGVLELDQYVDSRLDQTDIDASILKPNEGNLFVMPQIHIGVDPNNDSKSITTYRPNQSDVHKIMMADLSYYNYVLDADSIINMYQKGFNKYYAVAPTGTDPTGDVFTSLSYSDGKKRQLKST